MKVFYLKSLGAKLFYLMTALVLLTVVGNSWQFFRTFKNYQIQQLQDSLQEQAERVKDQVETSLETWRAQIAVALPTLRVGDEAAQALAMQHLVDANPDFIDVEVLKAPDARSTSLSPLGVALTTRVTDKNFGDRDAVRLGQQLVVLGETWLKGQIPKLKKRNYAVESEAHAVGLPVVVYATRFDVSGSNEVVWVVVHAWQSSMMKALVKSASLNSVLIDSKGRVFTSLDNHELVGRTLFPSRLLVKNALSSSSPSGFEAEYKDGKGRARVGAFARLQRYDLAVLVEQDAGVTGLTIKKTLLSTSLWGSLFVLFAVLFSFLGSSGITRGLRAVAYGTERIAAGDLKYQVPTTSGDEVGALGHSVNIMSQKIIGLLHSQVDKARFEKELETAKMVQSTFFPKGEIKRPSLEVFGFYQPASECGGDLWGHFTISDGLELVFIADAMGHGAPAALVTAMAYSTTMTIADIVKTDPHYRDSPAALMERINRIIYDAVRGTISMTFFTALIDTQSGRMTYANAGHNFPVILPVDAADPRIGKAAKKAGKDSSPQPITLKLMGTPLGIEADTKFKEATIELKAGDKIVFFTDGLIECTSPKGDALGRKKFLTQVSEGAAHNAEGMRDKLVNEAFAFFAGKPLADDITVVVAELARGWQPKALSPTEAAAAPALDVTPRAIISAITPELRLLDTDAGLPLVPLRADLQVTGAMTESLGRVGDEPALPPLIDRELAIAASSVGEAWQTSNQELPPLPARSKPGLEGELPPPPTPPSHEGAVSSPAVAVLEVTGLARAGEVPEAAALPAASAATVSPPSVAPTSASPGPQPGKYRLKLPSAG